MTTKNKTINEQACTVYTIAAGEWFFLIKNGFKSDLQRAVAKCAVMSSDASPAQVFSFDNETEARTAHNS